MVVEGGVVGGCAMILFVCVPPCRVLRHGPMEASLGIYHYILFKQYLLLVVVVHVMTEEAGGSGNVALAQERRRESGKRLLTPRGQKADQGVVEEALALKDSSKRLIETKREWHSTHNTKLSKKYPEGTDPKMSISISANVPLNQRSKRRR